MSVNKAELVGQLLSVCDAGSRVAKHKLSLQSRERHVRISYSMTVYQISHGFKVLYMNNSRQMINNRALKPFYGQRADLLRSHPRNA